MQFSVSVEWKGRGSKFFLTQECILERLFQYCRKSRVNGDMLILETGDGVTDP